MKRTLLYICHLYCESMYTHVYCDTSVAGVAQCALLVSLYVPVESRSYLSPEPELCKSRNSHTVYSYAAYSGSVFRINVPWPPSGEGSSLYAMQVRSLRPGP